MCYWLLTEATTSNISHTWILLNLLVSNSKYHRFYGVYVEYANHSDRGA